jgi:hypothetical protein
VNSYVPILIINRMGTWWCGLLPINVPISGQCTLLAHTRKDKFIDSSHCRVLNEDDLIIINHVYISIDNDGYNSMDI